MIFDCSRVNYWVCRIFTIPSLVFHLPPAYFMIPLLISISAWVCFHQIDQSTISWNRTSPCWHLCSCLPYVVNYTLLFCFEDPLKTMAPANLSSWLFWPAPIFLHPKHRLEHVRLHRLLDCLWRLSFYIHISLDSNKEDNTLCIHDAFFLTFSMVKRHLPSKFQYCQEFTDIKNKRKKSANHLELFSCEKEQKLVWKFWILFFYDIPISMLDN